MNAWDIAIDAAIAAGRIRLPEHAGVVREITRLSELLDAGASAQDTARLTSQLREWWLLTGEVVDEATDLMRLFEAKA